MIKKILLSCCAILLPLACLAQQPAERDSKTEGNTGNAVPQQDVVYRSVAQPPRYEGGDSALMDCIAQEMQYPQTAKENGIEGKLVVKFVVEKDGSVGDVKVVRSIHPDLDAEAVRVCKALTGFSPGMQNGQAVRVWYTLPIKFKL